MASKIKKTTTKGVLKTAPKKEEVKGQVKEPVTPPMNEPEVQAAKDADEKAVNEATTKRLNLLLGIVSQKFNLGDDYHVCQFNDKGKVMNITLENEDFAVAVTVKDSERHGLVVEQ